MEPVVRPTLMAICLSCGRVHKGDEAKEAYNHGCRRCGAFFDFSVGMVNLPEKKGGRGR